MDRETKELLSRKNDIQNSIEDLFKKNIKISDIDVPEADDKKVAELLLEMFEETISKIHSDVKSGKYDYY